MNTIVISAILFMILLALFGEKIYMMIIQNLWPKEIPDKIVGSRVRLGKFDNLGPNPPKQLTGTISHLSDDQYRIDLEGPFVHGGLTETYATITARHKGYPISRTSNRGILAVNGVFESGHAFTANIVIAPLSPVTQNE